MRVIVQIVTVASILLSTDVLLMVLNDLECDRCSVERNLVSPNEPALKDINYIHLFVSNVVRHQGYRSTFVINSFDDQCSLSGDLVSSSQDLILVQSYDYDHCFTIIVGHRAIVDFYPNNLPPRFRK